MQDLVLILSNSDDATAGLVENQLKEMEAAFYRLNTETFPSITRLTMNLSGEDLLLAFGDDFIPIEKRKIRSVWHRRPVGPRENPEIPEEYGKFIERESQASLWSLYTSIDAFWINPPLFGHRLLEHNKLHQLKVAAKFGILTPDTIITNNPEDFLAFCNSHGGVVAVKTIAGHFFIPVGEDKEVETYVIYTNRITADELKAHLDSIRLAPVMAQEYISKKLELRVTVVGDKIFACAIHSQDSERTKHDWRRYDFENVKHEIFQLPDDIKTKLISIMRFWRLQFGAIDMILTPDDKYVFLEINSNGQWSWIEGLTGMPISKAIAELLANPPKQ